MAHAIATRRGLTHIVADALFTAFDTVKTAVTNRLEYNKIVRELTPWAPASWTTWASPVGKSARSPSRPSIPADLPTD